MALLRVGTGNEAVYWHKKQVTHFMPFKPASKVTSTLSWPLCLLIVYTTLPFLSVTGRMPTAQHTTAFSCVQYDMTSCHVTVHHLTNVHDHDDLPTP